MIFALELSDDIDLTAVATLALAIVTVVLVVIGARALKQTKSEIELSRREVEEAHRPVLIPIIDETKGIQSASSTQVRPAKPYFVESQHLVVPIKNIGSGPGLRVGITVTPRNDAGEWSEAWGDRRHSGVLVGLGASEIALVTIQVPGLGGLPNFDVWVTYEDVAGKAWVTTAKYLRAEGGWYADLAIEAG